MSTTTVRTRGRSQQAQDDRFWETPHFKLVCCGLSSCLLVASVVVFAFSEVAMHHKKLRFGFIIYGSILATFNFIVLVAIMVKDRSSEWLKSRIDAVTKNSVLHHLFKLLLELSSYLITVPVLICLLEDRKHYDPVEPYYFAALMLMAAYAFFFSLFSHLGVANLLLGVYLELALHAGLDKFQNENKGIFLGCAVGFGVIMLTVKILFEYLRRRKGTV